MTSASAEWDDWLRRHRKDIRDHNQLRPGRMKSRSAGILLNKVMGQLAEGHVENWLNHDPSDIERLTGSQIKKEKYAPVELSDLADVLLTHSLADQHRYKYGGIRSYESIHDHDKHLRKNLDRGSTVLSPYNEPQPHRHDWNHHMGMRMNMVIEMELLAMIVVLIASCVVTVAGIALIGCYFLRQHKRRRRRQTDARDRLSESKQHDFNV
mmetsp:Transcript_10446/g.15699  ORF Transcript_10446/g.15699 Transcript_10446/m.15699 type:complete len:210 (-) Transcript_10446:7-636(-)